MNGTAAAPRLSVVIPSYNQGRFLERTLDSIFSQGYPNLEVIVIDGGSTDSTCDVLRRHASRIAYWVSEPDRGQSHALNKGFARATGELVAWQNADDTYLPGAFESAVSAFQRHPDKKIIFGDYLCIDADDNVLEHVRAFDFSVGHFIFEGFHLNAQATFWRREVHRRFGEFDEELQRTMDYDMLLRFALAEGEDAFQRIEQPLACFRRHPDQKTQGFDARVLAEHRRIASRWRTNRFRWPHRLLRHAYRIRRGYWYWKRGGGVLLWEKLLPVVRRAARLR